MDKTPTDAPNPSPFTHFLLASALLVAAAVLPARAAARFTATEIVPPAGVTALTATDVNASGTVVGYATFTDGHVEGFAWHAGTLRLLGRMPGGSFSTAMAINDAGAIVGDADDDDPEPRAVIWTDGTAASLLDLSNGHNGANLRATDINASGVVSGYYNRNGGGSTNHWEGVTWTPPYDGDFIALPQVPGSDPAINFTIAEAINDAGTTVGWTQRDAQTHGEGFAHGANGYTLFDAAPLPVGQNAYVMAIDAAGDIAGAIDYTEWNGTEYGGRARPFVARAKTGGGFGPQQLIDFIPGDISAWLADMNMHRDLVGTSYRPDGSARGYLAIGTTSYDLDTLIAPLPGTPAPVVRIVEAAAITNSGLIAATGTVNGQGRAFLLTPIPGPGAVTGLRVARGGAGSGGAGGSGAPGASGASGTISLTWDPACSGLATDFAVYEGTAGDWTGAAPVTCTTGGVPSKTLTPSAGSTFYLVVPHDGITEGSLGTDVNGSERPLPVQTCLPQSNPNRCP